MIRRWRAADCRPYFRQSPRVCTAPMPPLVRGGGFLPRQKAGGVVCRTYRISVGACYRRGDHRSPACTLPSPTAPANILRVRSQARPPCAKEAVSEADWRIVLLKSRHFPVFQIAPCRGRYFLVRQESTQRTDPGRRFKCGLSTVGRNRSVLPRPQSALPWVPLPPLRVS